MTKPVVEGPLGSPPFERLSISKGVTNFVMFKYSQQIPKVNYYSHPLKHKTKLTINRNSKKCVILLKCLSTV